MGRVNVMRTISVKAPAKINLTLDVLESVRTAIMK